MKTFIIILFFSLVVQARLTYPLQFGIGTDSCHPNKEGLKVCSGRSPQTLEIEVALDYSPDGVAAYGYHIQKGIFEKIGYAVSVRIVNFPYAKIDDMITLKVTTWSLAKPEQKQDVELEAFTANPQDLMRLNLLGKSVGTEDDYSNIVLSVRKSLKN